MLQLLLLLLKMLPMLLLLLLLHRRYKQAHVGDGGTHPLQPRGARAAHRPVLRAAPLLPLHPRPLVVVGNVHPLGPLQVLPPLQMPLPAPRPPFVPAPLHPCPEAAASPMIARLSGDRGGRGARRWRQLRHVRRRLWWGRKGGPQLQRKTSVELVGLLGQLLVAQAVHGGRQCLHVQVLVGGDEDDEA